MIPSESFSSDLSARWPTPSRRPEPCRLQRARSRRREDFPERAEERQSEKTTHTSTFDVLSLSGRLVEAQEETQDHTPRKQDSGFTHFAPTHRFQHHTRCHINPQTRCSGNSVRLAGAPVTTAAILLSRYDEAKEGGEHKNKLFIQLTCVW